MDESVEHECLKDSQIEQLKADIESLVTDVREARSVNYRLQLQLLEALAEKTLNITLPDKKNPVGMDVDKEECGDFVVYRGHLHMHKVQHDSLQSIPNDDSNDRKYVKQLFEVYFTPTYLAEKTKGGLTKQECLNAIESTKEILTMKEIYRQRINSGNTTDLEKRFKTFDKTIHKKIDNWYSRHGKKNVANSESRPE